MTIAVSSIGLIEVGSCITGLKLNSLTTVIPYKQKSVYIMLTVHSSVISAACCNNYFFMSPCYHSKDWYRLHTLHSMICIEVNCYNVSDSLGPNWMKKKQYLPHLQTFESGLSFSKTELEIIWISTFCLENND